MGLEYTPEELEKMTTGVKPKECLRCGVEKSLDNFPEKEGTADGHMGVCTPCSEIMRMQKEEEEQEKVAEFTRKRLEAREKVKKSATISVKDDEKFCIGCGVTQKKTEFIKNSSKKDGYSYYCNKCRLGHERRVEAKKVRDEQYAVETEETKMTKTQNQSRGHNYPEGKKKCRTCKEEKDIGEFDFYQQSCKACKTKEKVPLKKLDSFARKKKEKIPKIEEEEPKSKTILERLEALEKEADNRYFIAERVRQLEELIGK